LNLRKGQNRREYKVYTEHSWRVIFNEDEEHMLLFVPLFLFFPIKACRATLPPTMRQQSFQRLSANPIMDPVLKSIKFHLYPKRKTQKYINNNIFEAKFSRNCWMIHLIFHCLSFAKKSYFVLELYCLSTRWVLLNLCIHSNYCLWKPGISYC